MGQPSWPLATHALSFRATERITGYNTEVTEALVIIGQYLEVRQSRLRYCWESDDIRMSVTYFLRSFIQIIIAVQSIRLGDL